MRMADRRIWAVAAIAALLTATSPAATAPSRAEAEAAFQRFAALAGAWNAKSTKGWEEEMSARLIAGDSVVVMDSFDAHPGEEMLTMVLLDVDRLMLVHYCVAGNQPRLVAREISPDGRRVTFEFLDGTNLPARDKGHMDKAVFHFVDDDQFTSRWTWYQDGSEQWLEEIRYRRASKPDP